MDVAVDNDKINVQLTFSDNLTFTVGGVSFTMIYVEGGTFTMGATSEQGSDVYESEKPVHDVTLSDYYIGQTEVTQALWVTVMGSNPSLLKGNNKPVESISWKDCQSFVRKLNSVTGKYFRLPTEAEWEYAARGGNKSCGYKYSGGNVSSSVAWSDKNSGSTTHDVATKQSNEIGIYDMSGNVHEWCFDWWDLYNSNAQINPQGPKIGKYRVYRGGGWYDIGDCRVSRRCAGPPSSKGRMIGLRLAMSK